MLFHHFLLELTLKVCMNDSHQILAFFYFWGLFSSLVVLTASNCVIILYQMHVLKQPGCTPAASGLRGISADRGATAAQILAQHLYNCLGLVS